MRFIENVFVSENIQDINTVFYSLKRNIPVFNIYLIYIDKSGKCEISSSTHFLEGYEKNKEKTVCGAALGKRDAYALFAQIVEYSLSKGWKADDIGKNILKEEID